MALFELQALRLARTGSRHYCKGPGKQSGPQSRWLPALVRAIDIIAAIAVAPALMLATASTGAGASSATTGARIEPQKAFEISQSVIGRPVGDRVLTATNGQVFSLGAYRGKPLIISLVYSSCSSFCPITTQHLLRAVQQANRVIGSERFAVLTVGFDARNDTPARMALFAANQHIDLPNWRVASADAATIQALVNDLGFSYAELGGGFDHVEQTTIIGSDGKIFRHVYGEDFPIQMFMEPLKDAVYGTKTSWTFRGIVDHLKFICTTFDPNAGIYRIDFAVISGVGLGALSLILLGGWIVREWRRSGGVQGT